MKAQSLRSCLGTITLTCCLGGGIVMSPSNLRGETGEDKTSSPEEVAEEAKPASQPSSAERPPGGDGSMFFQVFVSRNDQNGDGLIEKSGFRGSSDRFDQMDKNQNGKLDRPEMDELHRSRVADPLSMRQRIEQGLTRRPPMDPSVKNAQGTNEDDKAAPADGEPTALTPMGTRITAKQAFARLDANADGKVTPTEFQRSPGMSDPAKAEEVVAKVDQNGDGSLSFDEFGQVFAKRNGQKASGE